MAAQTANSLPKKKLNKSKLKKTIKNVICRPDPVFWPAVTDDKKMALETVINQHKVDIPVYKKPLWKDLKVIPKEQRPKPPKIEKIEGLFFGISESCSMIQSGQCSAIIIEAAVNPRSIVQNVLEACIKSRVPVVCIEGLRTITTNNFGIPTSCLGVKKDFLTDISQKVSDIGSIKLVNEKIEPLATTGVDEVKITKINSEDSSMDVESSPFQYLYRTNKKTRVFVPPSDQNKTKEINKFTGQDFIEFSAKPKQQNKDSFKKMIVKRITNNPKRTKVK